MNTPRLWQLFLLALLLWGGETLRRDLWNPDEVRYAYIAREMAQDQHWLVPFRSGEYYAHKPPYLFWAINLVSHATRMPIGRIPVRLPGLLAGVFVLWATARLATRWAGARAAWPAVLTLCANYMFWHEIGFARMDGPLLGWTMAALTLLFLNDDQPTLWRPAVAWLCMGMGVLTKGPVGLLTPAGAYIAARLAAGEGRLLKKSHWLWGPFLGLALPGLWLALAWRHGAPPGYFSELLFSQNIQRAAGILGHRQSFAYFFGVAPAHFLPWTLCLPAAILVLRRTPEQRQLLRRLLGRIGFIFVFFSLMTSKRTIYILGLFPALAILVGGTWTELATATDRWARLARGAFLWLLTLAGPAVLIASFLPLPIPGRVLWPTGLAALAGAVCLWRTARQPTTRPRFYFTAAIALLAVQATIGALVYPAVNPLKTPGDLLPVVAAQVPADGRLLIYGFNGEIMAYYTQRRGQVLYTPEDLRAAMQREQRGVVVFEKKGYARWAPGHLAPTWRTGEFASGGRDYVWLAFEPARAAQ